MGTITAIADEFKGALATRPWATAAALAGMLMGVSVALSPTGLAVAAPLLLVFWLADGRWRSLPTQLRDNFSQIVGLCLMLVIVLGVLDSAFESDKAWKFARKYRELVIIPVLFGILTDERFRRWVLAALMTGIAIMIATGLLRLTGWLGNPGGRVVYDFHHHITFSALASFFSFWSLHQASDARGWRRLVFLALAAMSLLAIFAVSRSRTGYVLMLMLMALFVFQRFEFKRAVAAGVAFAALLAAIYWTVPGFRYRVNGTIEAALTHTSGDFRTSVDQRLELFDVSLELIAEKPVFGYGTGSFPVLYEINRPDAPFRFHQPHSEYLLIAVEQGTLGLILLLLMFGLQFRESRRLTGTEKCLAQGVLAWMAMNCLINSALLDSGESHFYAVMTAIALSPRGQPRPADAPTTPS